MKHGPRAEGVRFPSPDFVCSGLAQDLERRSRRYVEEAQQLPLFLPEYPKREVPLERYYVDQVVVGPDQVGDRWFMSAYTQWGIHVMDSMFIKVIRSGRYTLDQVEAMVLCNPHLHGVIKTNLIENARRCLASKVA